VGQGNEPPAFCSWNGLTSPWKSRVSESSTSGKAAFFGDFNARNPASDVEKAGFLNRRPPAGQRFSVTSTQETRLLMLKKPGF
jgi:hypothetical protein